MKQMSEEILLGTIAVRTQNTNLLWDTRNLRFKNNPDANKLIKRSYRKGWEI